MRHGGKMWQWLHQKRDEVRNWKCSGGSSRTDQTVNDEQKSERKISFFLSFFFLSFFLSSLPLSLLSPSFIHCFLRSLLLSFFILSLIFFFLNFLPFFLPSFLPSLLLSFLLSFLPSFFLSLLLPSFLQSLPLFSFFFFFPSFLPSLSLSYFPSFLPSLLPSFSVLLWSSRNVLQTKKLHLTLHHHEVDDWIFMFGWTRPLSLRPSQQEIDQKSRCQRELMSWWPAFLHNILVFIKSCTVFGFCYDGSICQRLVNISGKFLSSIPNTSVSKNKIK